MALIRSSIFFKNILTNIHHGTSYFIAQQVGESKVFFNPTYRYYATDPNYKRTLPLKAKLKRLQEFAFKGNYISRSNVNELMHAIELEKGTPIQYWQCLTLFGEWMSDEMPAVRTKLAKQLWESLHSRHRIELSHYNALLNVYVDNEEPLRLDEVISELDGMNLSPNVKTIELVMKSDARKGDLAAVERSFNLLSDLKIRPNEGVFGSLILAHGMAGEKEKALAYLDKMKKYGCDPKIDTYVTVLRVHAMYGDVETISSEINRLKVQEINLQDKDILQVVYQLAISGHGSKCKELYGFLAKRGFYNRLAANTINRLIEKKQDDVAMELLKTLTPKQDDLTGNTNSGAFVLDKLIKDNRSGDDILAMCTRLQQERLHSQPFHTLLQKMNDCGLVDQVLPILRAIKAKGIVLTEDNFRGLFSAGDVKQIQDSLRAMIREFDMKPSLQFLRTVVVPKLDTIKKAEDKINLMLTANVPGKKAALAVAIHCLQNKRLKDATDIVNFFKVHVHINVCQPALIAAVKSKYDVDHYVAFLRAYFEPLPQFSRAGGAEIDSGLEANEYFGGSETDRTKVIGRIVYQTLRELKAGRRVELLTPILKGLVEEGVPISSEQAKQIEKELGELITADISSYLKQLQSGDLELKPIPKIKPSSFGVVSTSAHLEHKIEEDKVTDKTFSQIELLKAYCREGETEKADQSIKQLESEDVTIPEAIYVRLIQTKVNAKDAAGAIEVFDKYNARHGSLTLPNQTVIEVITLLIEDNQIDEALEFLEKTKRTDQMKPQERRDAEDRSWKLLNRLSQDGKETELNQIFNSLVDNGHITATNYLLGPLINVHLFKEDLNKAVETFERLAKQYNETPHKNSLCIHLILADELDILRKVIEISSAVHDEHKCVLDLAFCYIECGRVRSAENIFQNPNLSVSQQKVNKQCGTYNKQGSIQKLEDLAKASRKCELFRREPIFENLLDLYIREDLSENALNLWVTLQEENETPSPAFLNKLGNYLKSKKMEVPFEFKEIKENKPKQIRKQSDKPKQYQFKGKRVLTQIENEFIGKLQENKYANIIQAYQDLSKSNVSAVVSRVAGTRNLYNFFNVLAEAGDVQGLEKVDRLLPEEYQKRLWFRNSYAKAFGKSERAAEWIEEWSKKLNQALKEEDLKQLDDKFPEIGFCSLVNNNPKLYSECEALAQKYADKNILGPMNAIWCNAVINGYEETAKKIWSEYIENKATIEYGPITEKAINDNNDSMLLGLIEHLQTSTVTLATLNGLNTGLLSIYLNNNRFDDALNIAETLKANEIPIRLNDLKRLKAGLEKDGKKFPFESDLIKGLNSVKRRVVEAISLADRQGSCS